MPEINNYIPEQIKLDIETVGKIPRILNMLEVICESTGMGFSAVARVTTEHWIACLTNDKIGFGLNAGGELKLDSTLCHEISQHHRIIAIDNVSEDPIYFDHRTPKLYGLQSYISVPIILRDGSFFGTLCAIDPGTAKVNNKRIIDMFTLFADLIAFHLDAENVVRATTKELLEEQRNAEIREQFIAMLGHDLRNPVNAISNAVQLQLRSNLDDNNRKFANIISNATARTKELIDNILDFASGRLGSGIVLNKKNSKTLNETLFEVINELRITWPQHVFSLEIDVDKVTWTDNNRMAQLFSNLLSNAITHGDPEREIRVRAGLNQTLFSLQVINHGVKIPEASRAHLFKPFSRGKHKPGREGLGLGLFIASEIAKAHGGSIEFDSDHNRTIFTVLIPDLLNKS